LDVDPESDIDMGAPESKFAEYALRRLPQLSEPFLLTIQLSNGHYPYYVEEAGPQPFQPASSSKDPEDASAFFNRYRNAVHQEDQHLAELLRGILSRPGGARTVIVYTSDHGEAFREHQQLGHTLSLFDEELRVPAWVYAPEGTLTAVERQNLKEQRARFVTHPDLTATILDLMGVWDEPGIARFRSKMIGRSLLRPLGAGPILPLTNCAPIWTCAFENWGVMKEHMKLHARAWDDSYRCFNLKLDPEEKVDLGPKACGHLELAARQYFRRLPGKRSQP
jgi:arylsulfatase A-like enzyme